HGHLHQRQRQPAAVPDLPESVLSGRKVKGGVFGKRINKRNIIKLLFNPPEDVALGGILFVKKQSPQSRFTSTDRGSGYPGKPIS
ncbi:MAG: hypothetical protein ACP5D5_09930, partial [Acidithiobacillus sp.]|uniref:hypothetical protein n=1 Tax=Acidithiobacillus sp. TaxID=1872118 RepID=UPI003D079AB7